MKRALLVSPYFIPCNLAGVHRTRLLAKGLPEFGWEPVVLSVEPRHYGSSCEPKLNQLLPDRLRVERVEAISSSISSRLGIGDLSLRAFWTMRRQMCELLTRKEVDLVFVSVLPGYSGLLGGWAKRHFGVPFVLDYQDPWGSDWGAAQPRLSKAGVADALARRLEPRFAPLADAITAVSEGTLTGLRDRGLLLEKTPTLVVPIGADPGDQEVACHTGRSHIEKKDGVFDFAFVGTLTDRMFPSLIAALRGFRRYVENESGPPARLHLLGTSGHASDSAGDPVAALLAEHAGAVSVRYEPRRIPYLDALRTMQMADALLLLGSTDTHYTASKIFPCWLTKRPIVGLAHPESSVHEIADTLGGIQMIAHDERRRSKVEEEFSNLVAAVVRQRAAAVPPRDEDVFERYTPAGIGRRYAELFARITNP